MVFMLAALVIQLPPLPRLDPCDPATMQEWSRAAKPVLRKDADYTWRGATAEHLEIVRALPAEAIGKQQYVEFLKETYGYNIERLNAAYGLSASAFTDLYAFDYRALNRLRDAVRRDDKAFLKAINSVLFADAQKFAGQSVTPTGP